jgi:hypothetical protein
MCGLATLQRVGRAKEVKKYGKGNLASPYFAALQ